MTDPLVVARAMHIAATLALLGVVIFGAAVAAPALRRTDDKAAAAFRVRFLRIAWLAFAVALISGVAWFVLLAAQSQTFGNAWLVRLVPAGLLAVALWRISPAYSGAARWVIAALLAIAFALALVHAGHAAATRGWLGTFHRAVDGLHLIAASAWLGGLVPLALLLAAARRGKLSLATAREAAQRFSTLGVIRVGTLIATGIANGWILAGGMPVLIGTDYGRLLLVKVALFLAMVAIAALNRLRLTPRLIRAADAPSAPPERDVLRLLVRNSLIEIALGLAILAVVGLLGITTPGSQLQPTWPFSLRYSDAAFADPQLRGKLVLALWVIAGGFTLAALSIVVGLVIRRLRWWLIATGGGIAIAAVLLFAPTLGVLTVEAFTTSYYVSPTGYSAGSIVRGAELFATHCASCHGRRGRGDGPAGRFFRVKPSDLTADHVYAHRDGDLYWWIVNGLGDVMPPLGAALDEDARWSAIDFVRANADAARLRDAPAKVTNVGYRAPDFSAVCPDGSKVTRDDLRGRVAHLVIVGTESTDRLAQLATRDRGVVTIAVPIESVSVAIACHPDAADLAEALTIYRGKDAGLLAGTEFLVDASGSLRAMWAPGRRPDWRDAEVLQREIAAIRDHPAATRPTGSHLHERVGPR